MRAIVNNYDGRAAPQERLGAMYAAREEGTVGASALPMVESNIARLEREIRAAEAAKGDRYIDTLVGGSNGDDLNRLFNLRATPTTGPQAQTGLLRRRMIAGEGGFQDAAEWQAIAQQADLPPDWQAHVQHPRVVDTRTANSLNTTQRVLAKNMPFAANEWRFAREANSGLAVMSRELPNGRFIMFKTATPSKFIPPSIFDVTENRTLAYLRRVERPINRSKLEAMQAALGEDTVLNRLTGVQRDVTHEALDTMRRGGTLENYYNMLPAGMRQLGKEGAELASKTWDWVKGTIGSADAQFRNAPGAGLARILLNAAYDLANGKASMWTVGRVAAEEGKNLLWRTLRPRGGIQPLMQAITETEFQHAVKAISNGGTLDGARAFLRNLDNPELENKLMSLLEYTSKAATETAQEVRLTEEVLRGRARFTSNENHYGMNHLWIGNHRMKVIGENGKPLGVGAGRSSAEAITNARNIARETNGTLEGRTFVSAGAKEDELLLREIGKNRDNLAIVQSPAMRETIFRGGATGDIGKAEFYKLFDSKVRGEYKYLADMITREHLGPDIANVRRIYGDTVADQLEYRAAALRGEKGIIDKAFNTVVDKALRPWIGPNSADKLVQMYNKLEFANLVFMSPAYLMQNILTPIQTVLPGVAHLINGNPMAWQRFMDFVPSFGLNGKPSGFQGFLSSMRMMSASVRSLARPNAEEARDIARVVGEGRLAPRFIDEYAGTNSKFGQAVGEGFATGNTLAERATNATMNTLKMFSTTPAARVEELSRAYAFFAGRHVAIARGITDQEQIYQVGKRFMDRTMYQYAAADRAKIFNGPAGSMFGLFKNWVFQNINDLSLYSSKEAFRTGNLQPLMLALGGQATLAGVGGMTISGVADGLSRWFTDKSLMQHVYEAFGNGPDGNNVADALYFGMPGLLGVSLQNQLASIGSDPQQDINFLHNFVALRRAQKVSTLVNYFTEQWQATGNPLASERTWDMINYAIGPRVAYKLFAEVEDGALRSIRDGRPITEITSEQDRWVNSLGMQPVRIARAYEAASRLYADRAAQRAMTSRLGEAYARAVEANDEHAITFILRRAVETGADVSSVMRSAAVRMRGENRPVLRNDFKHNPQTAPLLDALGL